MATTRSIPRLAASSVAHFFRLATSGALRLRRDRVGELYRVEHGGTYRVFRETVSDDGTGEPSAVLVVGFRLRLVRSNPVMHWFFQRVCVLTTPFWSGFRGFRVKLWMVDPQSKDYLGIYDWSGAGNARTYADALVRVLRPLSTPGSVWYDLHPDQGLGEFLRTRKQEPRAGEASPQPRMTRPLGF
jgi:hypothetical protein